MPKKFGINSKSREAVERRESSKKLARETLIQQQEDAQWAENDKQILKKQQRKEEKEAKQRESDARRAEVKALREAEERSLDGNGSKEKTTHFMIQRKLAQTTARAERQKTTEYAPLPLEGDELVPVNLREQNRALFQEQEVAASGLGKVAASLDKLGIDDKKPHVTYKEFESRKLPGLKRSVAGLRLSQYREMIWTEWKRSAENPANAAN
ncbi:hypothetical protein XU18_2602 [Perkinsela sp. CCAP 1560/4]|nr:hypothetical protein XU18_2602 [Perkinsela sp. CCAP 1560/4]|eukprot:KNH06581.1 hypothetical protein XU18_2602 [Perkinsela sp. CCAP 1560/4]